MMEMLVAVLVMGVGVLGVTGLQLVSLQNNQSALMRADAVQMAYDILDRIRMNDVNAYDDVNLGEAPAAAPNCVEGECTLEEMALFDMAVWKCSLGSFNEEAWCEDIRNSDALPTEDDLPGLPNGDGGIETDANGFVTVTVQWTGFNNEVREIEMRSRVSPVIGGGPPPGVDPDPAPDP